MSYEPDILMQSPDGFPVAVVEVKNREQLTADIATWIRADHLSHGLSARVPFFLLVSQDIGYLWDQIASPRTDAPPSYEFSMRGVMERYFPESAQGERVGSAQLELIIFQWLRDILDGGSESLEGPEHAIARSGMLSAMRGGRVISAAIV